MSKNETKRLNSCILDNVFNIFRPLVKYKIKNKNDFTKNFDVESQFEKIYITVKYIILSKYIKIC